MVLRLWSQPTRVTVTVTVTDTGPGSSNPFVGLLPASNRNDQGLGLWLSHQLVDVTHRCNPDGYTVCLFTTHPTQRSAS